MGPTSTFGGNGLQLCLGVGLAGLGGFREWSKDAKARLL